MAFAINFNTLELKSMKTVMAPRRGNEFNNNIRLKSRKCLFGPTNPTETYAMVKENFDQEREKFYKRFGVHMEDIDRLTIDEEEYKKQKYRALKSVPVSTTSVIGGGGKMINKKTIRMTRALKPYNANNQQNCNQTNQQQMKITDFCQVKKSPTCVLENFNGKKMQQPNGLSSTSF